MVKVSAVAQKFFGGDEDNLLNTLAAQGFKVEGYTSNTNLPLENEEYRARFYATILQNEGVTQAQYLAALNVWQISVAQTQNTAPTPSEMGNGAIATIEDAAIDAIVVQSTGLQQLAEQEQRESIARAKMSGVNDATVKELARLGAEMETKLEIRSIVREMENEIHNENQQATLILSQELLAKIQAGYSKTVQVNAQLETQRQESESFQNRLFARIAGLRKELREEQTQGE